MPDKPLPPTPDYTQLPRHDPDAVRCENCGMLAQVLRSSRAVVPAEEQFRQQAKIARNVEYGELYERNPVCVAGKQNFQMLNAYGNLYHQDGFGWLKVLREDVSELCSDDFVRWVPGLSIKDHKEMLDRKAMLDWQAKQDQLDRDWRADEAEKQRKWQREERHLRLFELVILGGGLVVAIVLAAAAIQGGRGGDTTNNYGPPIAAVSATMTIAPTATPTAVAPTPAATLGVP